MNINRHKITKNRITYKILIIKYKKVKKSHYNNGDKNG